MTQPRIPWTRLGAEFVVIVMGVLVALGADAWWQGRGDRTREADYLEQVLADSRANLVQLDSAIVAEEWHMELAERLQHEVQKGSAPNVDSVRVWMGRRWDGWWYSDPRLLDGTATALVETGDLTLLRDPMVRSAILGHRNLVGSDMDEFRRHVQLGMEAVERLTARGEAGLTEGEAQGTEREVLRTVALYRDPEGRAAMERLRQSYYDRTWYLKEMRSATESLISILDPR